MVVGAWAQEKHDLLAEYIVATRHMRKRFTRRTYVELFCGPGKVWYEHRGPYPGSALRAWEASRLDGAQFTEVYINDLDPENVAACRRRLEEAGARVIALNMPADQAGPAILERLGGGLHLALLDPFSIGVLPWTLVGPFATHPKMDIVVNVNISDLRRNLGRNIVGDAHDVDGFCPNWRSALTGVGSKVEQRLRVFQCWLDRLKTAGAEYSREMPLVRDSRLRVGKYHLVFAAHHPAPIRVWSDLAKPKTRTLPF
jgi:three-Cys-motif partner protein